MAESYLSDILNTPVTVGGAHLSIFEGLRLEKVKVYADAAASEDSVVFTADSFLIRYSPRSMLQGRIDATQIVAIDPHFRLTENLDTGRWNYQALVRESRTPTTRPDSRSRTITVPEILLRNAQIDYAEIRSGVLTTRGSMAIEGRLWPGSERSRYNFNLQSRGENEGVGPVLSGSVVLSTGQVNLRLEHFQFGADIRSMLPAQVRTWWEQHELQGRVDIPELAFTPARGGKPATFRVETALDGVTLAIRPEAWHSRAENQRLEDIQQTFDFLRSSGIDPLGSVEPLAGRFDTTPIRLERVSGTFVFTQDGIDIKNVTGRLETNALRVNGRIDGYTPDAPAHVRITSSDTENIFIPHAPRYVNSMPHEVREIYDRFRPEGTCRILVDMKRSTPGERPTISGHVEIVDGYFTFERFPYPLRNATGKIVFGRDKDTGEERLDIVNIRGRGIAGGPNANSYISVNGTIAPLNAFSAVHVKIAGKNISSEPALKAAFPRATREALKMFDAAGAGEYPRFRGDFSCDVIRPFGYRTQWEVNVDIDIAEAAGSLVDFPYPLENVSAQLKIREGYLDIVNARVNRGDTAVQLDGRITFPGRGALPVPELKLVASNVPIDRQLLAALPPEPRDWLTKLGATGNLNIEGRIYREADHPRGVDLDLQIRISDGTLWPVDGVPSLTQAAGRLHLTPGQLSLSELTAKRGESTLTAHGSISLNAENPNIALFATARNLRLDDNLRKLLPAPAQEGWDAVKPSGTADADITYTGRPRPGSAEAIADASGAVADVSLPAGFEVTVRPRELSVVPDAIPYRLDVTAGTVTITPSKAVLTDVKATHGDGKVAVSGVGTFGRNSTWDLKLSAENLAVDDAFKTALPPAMKELIDNIHFAGPLSFAFEKLVYRSAADAAPAPATATEPSTTGPVSPPVDVDFQGTLATANATMDLGVPISEATGSIAFTGNIRQGQLNELAAAYEFPSLTLAGRATHHFRGEIFKSANQDALRIGHMRAEIAGGELAGNVDLAFPDDREPSFALSLVLRNAGVSEIAADPDKDLKGEVTASLNLTGNWNDPNSRRGRGDVMAAGKGMYKIPVVLGLLEIANLALPINSPFNEASTRYSVQGQTVAFESIQLRSNNMLMQGHGSLDFNTRKVRLTFTTDNPGWPKLPLLTDLIQGARHELLQIHVRGTIQDPKVSAAAMNTFQTTVDEVFHDNPR